MTTVSVFVGSITDPGVGAHAIVNAGNAEVALGSGVSGAIKIACGGSAYQEYVRERLEEDVGRPLEADECLVTGPGVATVFRWVLHVASVDYRRPDPVTTRPSSPARIRQCTEAFLEAGEDLARKHDLAGQFVVGAPLLGAHHGGQGETASLDMMMLVVARYARPDAVIAEVRFAVLEPRTAQLVEQCAFKHAVAFRS